MRSSLDLMYVQIPAAKDAATTEKVDLRLYRVIYNAIEDIEAAMKGMLDPEFEEKVIRTRRSTTDLQSFWSWNNCRFLCIRWNNPA